MRMLGKLAPRLDPRTLMAVKYMKDLSPPPTKVSFEGRVSSWPMLLNDQLGDCVPAAAGHMVEQWTYYAGKGVIPTDNDILRAYEAIGGYVPGDPSTDQGCDMLTALKYWRKTGIASHKIAAFISLKPGDQTELEQAIALFGDVFLGFALPLSAQNQERWEIDDSDTDAAAPGSWGGHCVPGVQYEPTLRTAVSWGALLQFTPNFYARYCDEAYAVLSQDWIEANGKSPSGFDVAQLQADLAEVTA